MTGLRIPADLEAWERWRARRTPLRAAKRRLRPAPARTVFTWTNSTEPPRAVVGVAAVTASGCAALVAPLAHLGSLPTIVQADQEIDHLVPGWTRVPTPATLPGSVRVVLADGHYLELGHELWRAARARDLPYLVAQHGLITPLAPPLAPGATLLAWSEQDGGYWRSGRADVSVEVIGSQLLWQAAAAHATSAATSRAPLIYLGQGHAAELSRPRLAHAALSTCRTYDAVYRPHPSERDVASRALHEVYARAGVAVDTSGVPLLELDAPVVSVFSTGVLEAAARGREAWVAFPRPPAWLSDFWDRYGMHRLGLSPTPAPVQPPIEPARRIAEIVVAAA